MERCEYCGTPFMKGETVDIGVGYMQVTANEPSCGCYDLENCPNCGEELSVGEMEYHYCEEEND